MELPIKFLRIWCDSYRKVFKANKKSQQLCCCCWWWWSI